MGDISLFISKVIKEAVFLSINYENIDGNSMHNNHKININVIKSEIIAITSFRDLIIGILVKGILLLPFLIFTCRVSIF
jgi:hypothetical protein